MHAEIVRPRADLAQRGELFGDFSDRTFVPAHLELRQFVGHLHGQGGVEAPVAIDHQIALGELRIKSGTYRRNAGKACIDERALRMCVIGIRAHAVKGRHLDRTETLERGAQRPGCEALGRSRDGSPVNVRVEPDPASLCLPEPRMQGQSRPSCEQIVERLLDCAQRGGVDQTVRTAIGQ